MKQILSLSVLMLMLSGVSATTWADGKDWETIAVLNALKRNIRPRRTNTQINMVDK